MIPLGVCGTLLHPEDSRELWGHCRGKGRYSSPKGTVLQAQLRLAACIWGSASDLLACLFSLHGSRCGEQLLQGQTLSAEGDGRAGRGGPGTSWVPENSVLWGQGGELRKPLAGRAFGEPGPR